MKALFPIQVRSVGFSAIFFDRHFDIRKYVVLLKLKLKFFSCCCSTLASYVSVFTLLISGDGCLRNLLAMHCHFTVILETHRVVVT